MIRLAAQFRAMRALILIFLLGGPAGADPFAAAGRIENRGGIGGCSAVLIAPDIVLTAAHCVRNKRAGTLLFRLGDRLGLEPIPNAAVAVHPLYEGANARISWKFRFDLAAVRLVEPVPDEIARPLPVGREAEVGETLFLASWRAGEGTMPRQRACAVIPGVPGLITLACEVKGGESGAPVLRKTAEGLELVGIISSRSQQANQPTAQASNIRIRLSPLLDIIEK